ncbi:GNAT family N-acetyltransferase, partial [Saccharospirillum sp.]|uniref:GNAT family N-acetyltransferase n=1 Tax=Saccharospirillum sp. TaxID=2033801 RepID=UPI0034A04306
QARRRLALIAIMNIQYQNLTRNFESQTIALLKSGLESHWERYDESYNPDISSLYEYYSDSMLIGIYDGVVVSCGGWKVIDESCVEVVRVSVLNGFQNRGVGTAMLRQLEWHLRSIGVCNIFLETTSTWTQVIKFYLKKGYSITHEKNGDTYFYKALCN